MKRKRFARLIACTLLLCLIPGILAFPVSAKYFEDVYPGMLAREFFDAINYVSDNNIMNGTEPTRFSPYENVTRGMFVTILYRYSGSTQKYSSSFSDVPSSKYYYDAVGWASHHGIVNGTTPTTFEPESPLTREQMTVILYRYAKSYEGRTFNASSFASITTHPDYSSVSSYAVESIRWAKTYHLIRLTTDTSYINATSNINRAFVALALANYAKNVTGFPQQDRFSFTNSSSNRLQYFHTINIMSSQALNRLDSCINAYYGTGSAQARAEQERIRNVYIGKENKGKCFGYTISLFLDKLGKIDFNKNFANNAATMNDVGIPFNNIATVETAINYYHSLQYLSCFSGQYQKYEDAALRSGPYALYRHFCNYGAMPFSFFWDSKKTNPDTGIEETTRVGHTVLLLNISRRTDGNYNISYINPNTINDNYAPSTDVIRISDDGKVHFYENEILSFCCFPTTAIHWFDNFDLDGDYNTSHYIPVNSSSSVEVSEVANINTLETATGVAADSTAPAASATSAFLTVPATKFQLTNAEGNTLSFDGCSFDGTMDVISEYMVPNGPDSPCTLVIELPISDYYEYTNLSDYTTSVSIISERASFAVSGNGIRSVSLDAVKNDLFVDGEEMDYSLYLRTNIPQFEYFYLNGNSNTSFTITTDGSDVIADGLTGTSTLGYSPADSLVPEFAPVTFSALTAVSFSDASTSGTIHVTTSENTASNTVLPIHTFVEGDLYE